MYFKKENIAIYFIIICTILLVILTIFIINIIMMVQRNNRRYFQETTVLKEAHENELLKTQIKVQENTFQQISREIHDNIGQKLSLAKLYLNMVDVNNYSKTKEVLEEVVTIMTTSLADLRDVSRSLSSDLIKNNGFIKALENEIVQLNKLNRYQFKLVVTGESVFLKAEKELVIFRIIQESLNNIMKHAEATQIGIKIYFSLNGYLEIAIQDNGKGFDVDANISSNGINNIHQRAKLLKGEASIQSVLQEGTIVHVKIPYYDNHEN